MFIRFSKLAAIGALLLALAACASPDLPFPDDTSPATTTATTAPADKAAAARDTLQKVEFGATLAEIGYDTLCAPLSAPKFCTDPAAVAAYADTKALLATAFQTAQDALDANGTFDEATITKLLSDATKDLVKLEAVIADIKSGKTPAKS